MSSLFDSCYSAANSVEETERIDTIPGIAIKYSECWKISTEIFVGENLCPIVLYVGFNSDFPYSLPSFYYQSLQFGYIPHIESKGGKICLFEDGTSYNIGDPINLVLYCIKKAKKLVQAGAEKKNFADFSAEITSYWRMSYEEESEVDNFYLIYDNIPLSTTILNSIKYSMPIAGINNRVTFEMTLIYDSDVEPFNSYISRNFSVNKGKVLFVEAFQIPYEAPYDMTFETFLNGITREEDRKKVVNFVNRNSGGEIIFPLTQNNFGGIIISPVELKRNGFRNGAVKTSDVYQKFEKKYTKLDRLYGSLYSNKRIAERTLGTLMPEHKYAIAGMGSVGSNLVHFLNGYNNASFTLIDDDTLSIDNIGRHLLGFQYINQFKVYAVAEHLHSIRPDQEISAVKNTLQEYIDCKIDELNRHTALFVCTGDTMTDEFIINAINNKTIKIPVFLLWMEPYGISGHLIYINGVTVNHPIVIINPNTMLYKYNLIDESEYTNQYHQFSKKDAGCNGMYSLYSGNDVLEMLCAFYPIILKQLSTLETSKCYRWIGNVEEIAKKGIRCKEHIESLYKGLIQEFPI